METVRKGKSEMQIAKILLMSTMMAALLVGYSLGRSRANDLRSGQDSSVEKWVRENYPVVLNKLIPDGELSPAEFPKNVRWMVTVRISSPYEKPEYRFSMEKMYDGKVEVSVISARSVSLRTQLQALKRKYPHRSLEEIIASVSIERRAITQAENSELDKLAAQFEVINMSPVLPDELRVDDTGYEFWSQSLWGNRMSLILRGPGSQAKKQPHPLLQWAESIRSFMDSAK